MEELPPAGLPEPGNPLHVTRFSALEDGATRGHAGGIDTVYRPGVGGRSAGRRALGTG